MNFGDPRLPQRFWDKVQPCPMSGCWIWVGAWISNGYGHARANAKRVLSHRLTYQVLIGPVPDGLQLDHLCRVRACCNPRHLEPVTAQENARRGDGGKETARRKMAMTHCKRGHSLAADNTYRVLMPNGNVSRKCKQCQQLRKRTVRSSSAGVAA